MKKGQVRTGNPNVFEFVDGDGDRLSIAVNQFDETLISITNSDAPARSLGVLLDEEASRAIRFFFNKRFPLRRPYRSEKRD